MRICPKCKAEYPDDKKFCKDCRVQLISTREGDSKIASKNIDTNSKSALPIAEEKENHPELANKMNTEIRKKKNRIIILISVLLVCIIVGYLTIDKLFSKKPITDLEIAKKEDSGNGKQIQEVYSNPLGEWVGKFGEKQIRVVIDQNDNGLVSGYNILNGKKRTISGKMTKIGSSLKFILNEPGDDKWDGVFNFIISDNKLEGTWNSNNGRLTRSFVLNKDSGTIYANKISNDVSKNSNGTNNRVNDQNFYILNVAAVKTEEIAKAKVNELRGKGKDAGYLWIPDYASLSGAKLYSIYLGPFSTQRECEVVTEEYREMHPDAYGLLVSQDHRRTEIKGIGKIVIKPN